MNSDHNPDASNRSTSGKKTTVGQLQSVDQKIESQQIP